MKNIFLDGLSKGTIALCYVYAIRVLNEGDWASASIQIIIMTLSYQCIFYALNQLSILEQRTFDLILALKAATISLILAIAIQLAIGELSLVSWIYLVGLCGYDVVRTSLHKQLKFMTFSAIDTGRAVLTLALLIYFSKISFMGSRQLIFALSIPLVCAFGLYYISVRQHFSTSKLGLNQVSANGSGMASISKLFFDLRRQASSPKLFYIGYIISTAILGQLELFFVRENLSTYDVSVLATANRYFVIFMTVLSTINSFYLGHLAKVDADFGDISKMQFFFDTHLKFALKLLPFIFLIFASAPYLLHFLNNGKYPEINGLLPFYAIIVVFSFLFSPFALALIKLKMFRSLALAGGACLLLNIGLNLAVASLHNLKFNVIVNVVCGSILNLSFYLIYRRKRNEKYAAR